MVIHSFRGKDKKMVVQRVPQPIDIATILEYNRVILGGNNPEEFLEIMQSLDDNFISHNSR